MGCKFRLKVKVCLACDAKPTAHCVAAGHTIVLRESGSWMLKWSVNGKVQIESARTTNAKEADALLALKEGAQARGIPITSKVGKIVDVRSRVAVLEEGILARAVGRRLRLRARSALC